MFRWKWRPESRVSDALIFRFCRKWLRLHVLLQNFCHDTPMYLLPHSLHAFAYFGNALFPAANIVIPQLNHQLADRGLTAILPLL